MSLLLVSLSIAVRAHRDDTGMYASLWSLLVILLSILSFLWGDFSVISALANKVCRETTFCEEWAWFFLSARFAVHWNGLKRFHVKSFGDIFHQLDLLCTWICLVDFTWRIRMISSISYVRCAPVEPERTSCEEFRWFLLSARFAVHLFGLKRFSVKSLVDCFSLPGPPCSWRAWNDLLLKKMSWFSLVRCAWQSAAKLSAPPQISHVEFPPVPSNQSQQIHSEMCASLCITVNDRRSVLTSLHETIATATILRWLHLFTFRTWCVCQSLRLKADSRSSRFFELYSCPSSIRFNRDRNHPEKHVSHWMVSSVCWAVLSQCANKCFASAFKSRHCCACICVSQSAECEWESSRTRSSLLSMWPSIWPPKH